MHHISTLLLDSCAKTLKNIEHCTASGSFSDANTLIRKLRDDLILYVYILDVANNRNPFSTKNLDQLNMDSAKSFSESFSSLKFNENLSEDEKAVAAWFENTVEDLPKKIKKKLSFENYMTYLRNDEKINKILNDYKLQDYWLILTTKLNDYVHSNGIRFTGHNLIKPNNEYLEIFFKNINFRVSYILTFFLILILITESALISSGEVIDYLDLGINVPEGIQYEIAPFIQKYIDEKVVVLHPELKKYLQDNNNCGMNIE